MTGKMYRGSRVRVVVLGAHNVGKTALIVRCLTKRFLPEYASGIDSAHHYDTTFGERQVEFDLIDWNGAVNLDNKPDCVIGMYSITSRKSFQSISTVLYALRAQDPLLPAVLVGNKADLDHRRQISSSEGLQLAEDTSCAFFELSVADDHNIGDKLLEEAYKSIELIRSASMKRKRDRKNTPKPKVGKKLFLTLQKRMNSI